MTWIVLVALVLAFMAGTLLGVASVTLGQLQGRTRIVSGKTERVAPQSRLN